MGAKMGIGRFVMAGMVLFGGLGMAKGEDRALICDPAATVQGEEPQSFLAAQRPLLLDDAPMINPALSASSRPAATDQASEAQLPPVTVFGESVSPLREEDRIGSYRQPRWTAQRRFPNTRVYVRPEGSFEFEGWMRFDVPRKGRTELQQLYEVEIGLPHRFQLDLYAVSRSKGDENFFDQKVELRYALADWGKIWGNPTFYLEYNNRDQAPDKVEAKLLLGGEIRPGWHWGQNFVFEAETGGEREYEYAWTGGLSYTVIDQKLSVGAETEISLADVSGDRGDYAASFYVGPSLQYRPRPNMHLDIAPLIGIGGHSKAAKILLVFGYEF